MNKNAILAITAIAAVSLILNIVTIRKLSALQKDVTSRSLNIENRVNNLQSEIYRIQEPITSSIKKLLEENASSIGTKNHTILNYNKAEKRSDVRISVNLKEVDQNAKIYLKEEKQGVVDTIPMEAAGGLTYTADRRYKIGETAKLSVIINGAMIKEEYLFDFNLKELLENRITYAGGSQSAGSSAAEGVSFGLDFNLRNNHKDDPSLKLTSVQAKLEGNGKVIFNENFNSFFDNGDGFEGVLIDMNKNFVFKEDTDLKLTITAIDNLGLTYELNNEFTVTLKDGLKGKPGVTEKGSYEFKLK